MTSPTGSKNERMKPSQARPRTAPCRARGGLTLVEVLISVVLLASGAVLIMQAFARIWHTEMVAERQSTAYLFVLSKLADLELASHQGEDLTKRASGMFRVGQVPFTWHLAVQPDGVGAGSGTAQHLNLSVTWPRGRQTEAATYDLLLSPGPPPS